ncbi:GyrI-like domain-containing protein [Leptospira yasudae]|uniref:GyrI-like domain-containing protein n=1 Tax=Leptospira yasudae TaxID=2202201 RepID=UPI001C4FA099|nr:GyrI-like domain-containing protein [Leptospira yasudae]MBW0435852.1 GyrI-like domain-containing protein [Leptospira yasudae]
MKQSPMPKKNLIGVRTRTKNADEFGPNGKIGPLWGKFFQEVFPKLSNPGDSIYAVYWDYESDENGEYSYFIGVPAASDNTNGFETLSLPEGTYLELATEKGKSPDIVVQLWQQVWSDSGIKNRRAFATDYEIYPINFAETPETQVRLYLSDKQKG